SDRGDAGECASAAVVQRVGIHHAVGFDSHEEDARSVIGVIGGIVRVPLALVEEALGDQEGVGDPGDSFHAEVGSDDGKIGGEVPFVGGGQGGARGGRIETQNAVAADGVYTVVAFGGDVETAGRSSAGERHALRIGITGAAGISHSLAGAPAVRRIGN